MATAFTPPTPLPRCRHRAQVNRRRPRATPVASTLQPRRSKMILTRRIHTWTLKPPPPSPSKSKRADKTKNPHVTQTSSQPNHSLNHNPHPAFVFRRPSGHSHKRRPADPPYRFLQLSTRKGAALKQKLSTASKKKLMLTPQHLFRPSGEVVQSPLHAARTPLPLFKHLSKLSDRVPRLIVIGDVHGCITELQALLKLADYQHGDQILLLGDLVAKGPDSVAVVQLAKELGARAVRGNHDYEVVRWSEIRKRGTENDVSVEHARIARMLSPAEHAWLMDCPWFIESPEMNYLFVHAGFIPGVKLTQQNPRLMMNMRSVLKDGTVTARNVVGCEWGRLWQGPQTVVFGHDAYRGLQKYDYATGIDTGCVYGGRLTALVLPENRLLSVPAKRAYISPKRFRPAKEPVRRERESDCAAAG